MKEFALLEDDMGDFQQAYIHLQQYEKIRDSLATVNNQQTIHELETKYRTSEKEKQLQWAENKAKQERLNSWGLAAMFFMLLFFTLYMLYQRKKGTANQLSILEQKKEFETTKALLEGEEIERKRIAKELHDGIGGNITGLKMKLETANQTLNSKILSDTITALDTTLNELRRTSKNLKPRTLLRYGLEKTLDDYLSSMENSGVKIVFQHHNLCEIPDKAKELNIYRIIQELVSNAIKHGKPKNILVQISCENRLLLIDVEDDGIGFIKENTQKNMGLDNIEVRVKALNGNFIINSEPNKGTSATITCKL